MELAQLELNVKVEKVREDRERLREDVLNFETSKQVYEEEIKDMIAKCDSAVTLKDKYAVERDQALDSYNTLL